MPKIVKGWGGGGGGEEGSDGCGGGSGGGCGDGVGYAGCVERWLMMSRERSRVRSRVVILEIMQGSNKMLCEGRQIN